MVKHAAGALMQTFAPGPHGEDRRSRVYLAIVDAILDGRLPPGARLPSARQLASEWRLARGVVDEAFARLQDEGLLVRRVGDGSYVAYPLPRSPRPHDTAALRRAEDAMQRAPDAPLPMHPQAWPAQDFPLASWRRAMSIALSEPHRDQLGYGPPAGLPALREAIARHLALTRSVRCTPAQVVVVNSPLQALETLVRALLSAGDRVWVEDPGPTGLPLLLEMLHLRAIGVPLDERGLCVARGRELAPDAAMVCLHPLTQRPLGIRTTAMRGAELLQWAAETGAWIVEGCFNDEIFYRGPAPPALHSRDSHGRVLLMGSFEGVMFPALRVAYLVLPDRLIGPVVAARGLLGDHTQVATQMALAAFMAEGQLTAHLRRLRCLCGERRDAMVAAVQRWLPGEVRLGPTESGFHACLHLAAELPDTLVVQRLAQRRIGGEALSSRCRQAGRHNGVVLSYAAASPPEIDAAMRQLAEVIGELSHERPAGPSRHPVPD